jgi:hypothetical protein
MPRKGQKKKRLSSFFFWRELRVKSTKGTTRLIYTGFHWGLEHLKIETMLIDEWIESVMRECVLESIGMSSILRVIRRVLLLL